MSSEERDLDADEAYMTPEAWPWCADANRVQREMIGELNEALSDVHRELSAANHALAIGGDTIRRQDAEINAMEADKRELQSDIRELQEQLAAKDAEIERLKADLHHLMHFGYCSHCGEKTDINSFRSCKVCGELFLCPDCSSHDDHMDPRFKVYPTKE